MGTFTFSYFAKTVFWRYKMRWAAAMVVFYFGRCWDKAAHEKVQMMKGKSLMYKDKIAAIPPGEDVWQW